MRGIERKDEASHIFLGKRYIWLDKRGIRMYQEHYGQWGGDRKKGPIRLKWRGRLYNKRNRFSIRIVPLKR